MKPKGLQILMLLFTFLMVAKYTYAQRPEGAKGRRGNMPAIGVLSGKIIDNGDQPVQFANVVLFSKRDSSMVTGTISNEKGEFRLDKLRFGRYYLVADFIGYEKTVINDVKVTPRAKQVHLKKILLQQATQHLDEIAIVADKSYVSYKIDRKVVNVSQHLNASGGTAADVLENTPSIDVDIDGNITLRGSSSFTVLIDGKPSILDGSEALEQLPADAIESIEIITNPSAKYEPDGTAGIINVILKKKKLQGISGVLNASYGTGNSYSADGMVNLRRGKWNVVFGGSYSDRNFERYGDGLRQTTTTEGTTFLDDSSLGTRGFGGWSVRGGADYAVTNNNTISLQFSARDFAFERNSQNEYHLWTTPSTNETYSLADNDFTAGGLGTQVTFTEALRFNNQKLDIVVVWDARNSDRENFSATFNTDPNFIERNSIDEQVKRLTLGDRNAIRLKVDYEWNVGENSKVEAGYQGRWEKEESDYDTYNFLIDLNEWEYDTEISNGVDYSRFIHAGYATYSNRFLGFDFKAGLRAEYTDRLLEQKTLDESYGYNNLDFFPSAYLSRKFGKNHQLQFNYSRRINRPRDYFLNPFIMHSDAYSSFVGNPSLKPEFSGSYELNYLLRIGKSSSIALESYYRKTDNEMTRIRSVDADNVLRYTIVNLNNDKRMGAELSGNVAIARWLTINPIADFYYYELDDKSSGDSEIRSSKNYNLRLNTTFRITPNTRAQLNGSYRSGSVTTDGEREPTYSVDLAFRQDLLKRKATVAIRVRDILQTRVREGYSFGENFRYDYTARRQSPFFMISFSYRLNNFKMKRTNRSGGGDMIDMD